MSCRHVYAIGATALLAVLAACGSGGDDGDGILPNGTSPPRTDTTTPRSDEVSRAAVVSGLTRAVSKSASAAAPDVYFSVLRSSGLSQSDASEFQSRSFLAPFSSSAENLESEVRLRLAWAAGLDAITFNGSGFVETGTPPLAPAGQGDTQSFALSAAQYSIPDPVPLDQTLQRWSVEGTPHGVRFFVGTIAEKPDQMRICWDIDLPSAKRVQCTRNLRSDGTPIAVEVLHDVSGTTLDHVGNDDESSPRSILRCEWRDSGQLTSANYAVFQHTPGALVQDYAQLLPYDIGSPPQETGYYVTVTYLDDGEIMYRMDPYLHRTYVSWLVAESMVVAYRRSAGSTEILCTRLEPYWRGPHDPVP